MSRLDGLLQAAEAVLLDFDGVLVESEYYHFQSYSRVFARLGHEVDEAEYYVEFTCNGSSAADEAERHGLADVDAAQVSRDKWALFMEYARSGAIVAKEGAPELVSALRASSKRGVIASNSSALAIETMLEGSGFPTPWPDLIGTEPGDRGKPAPDVFLRASAQLGVPPDRCLVIEDTTKGLRAAQAAGMPCVVVRTAHNASVPFDEADAVVDTLREVVEAL
jgi:HAD superfamily hydrolase (TIGR01509 family)